MVADNINPDTSHLTHHIPHFTPHTLHPTPQISHPTPNISHPTTHTPHPSPHTQHSTPCTPHVTPHSPHLTPHNQQPNSHPIRNTQLPVSMCACSLRARHDRIPSPWPPDEDRANWSTPRHWQLFDLNCRIVAKVAVSAHTSTPVINVRFDGW